MQHGPDASGHVSAPAVQSSRWRRTACCRNAAGSSPLANAQRLNHDGSLLLSRTSVSEIGERLWQDDHAFASRDLDGYDIAWLFVDGIAERIRPGQRRSWPPGT